MKLEFCHSGSLGDIVYSLPTVMSLGGGELYLKCRHYEIFRDLLIRQPYIFNVFSFTRTRRHYGKAEDAVLSNGKKVSNLDRYRYLENIGHLAGRVAHLAQYHLDIFGLEFDLSQSWVSEICSNSIAPIIVNRTLRHHDEEEIDWKLLKPYQEAIAFIGSRPEYKAFFKILPVQWHQCDNALEIAQAIKGSKLFVGNQSLCFALAEAMKHPRVLEVYYKRNNCQPQSSNGYTYLNKVLIEEHLK